MALTAIEMETGSDESLTVTITDQVTGNPINITGATLYFDAKYALSDPDIEIIIAKSTTAGGVTITNAASGLAQVELVPADTLTLIDEVRRVTLRAQVTLETGAGKVYRVWSGDLILTPAVRRVI